MEPTGEEQPRVTTNARFTSFASLIKPVVKSAASTLITLAFILWWGNSTDAFAGFTKRIEP